MVLTFLRNRPLLHKKYTNLYYTISVIKIKAFVYRYTHTAYTHTHTQIHTRTFAHPHLLAHLLAQEINKFHRWEVTKIWYIRVNTCCITIHYYTISVIKIKAFVLFRIIIVFHCKIILYYKLLLNRKFILSTKPKSFEKLCQFNNFSVLITLFDDC